MKKISQKGEKNLWKCKKIYTTSEKTSGNTIYIQKINENFRQKKQNGKLKNKRFHTFKAIVIRKSHMYAPLSLFHIRSEQ